MKTGGKLKKNLKKLCWNANFFFEVFFSYVFSCVQLLTEWKGEADDGVRQRTGSWENRPSRLKMLTSGDISMPAGGFWVGVCVWPYVYIYMIYTCIYNYIHTCTHAHTHTHVASMWHILVLPSRIGLEDTEALDRVVPHGGSGLHQGWCFLREQAGPEVFRGPQMGNWGFSSVELFDHAGVLKRSLY